jgi:UDP-glucose 4-epimerase
MKVLITGGAGYIGSHTIVELLCKNIQVVVIDDLSNSSAVSLKQVTSIAHRSLDFVQGSILDKALLKNVFSDHSIDAVIHFAALKAVGESSCKPLEYYLANVAGTLCLCEAMAEAGVHHLVFSSSATVYGDPVEVPLLESSPKTPATSPYGWSKFMIEQILSDMGNSYKNWSIATLRYFNPIGAHPSGAIGEDPRGIPNNLMPYISQVASGRLKVLSIYGDDYETPDGTGIRDYIHVVDLAKGHLAALEYIYSNKGHHVWNLGTGVGYSVKEIIGAFEKVTGCSIPVDIVARRPGDIAISWADVSKAHRELGWSADLGLEDMIRDAWHWQTLNPGGYGNH